jgi:hypothetical protein
MNKDQEAELLQEELAKYEGLARAFPHGAINATILDLIAELKQQILTLERKL